jgi:hypothetical protein
VHFVRKIVYGRIYRDKKFVGVFVLRLPCAASSDGRRMAVTSTPDRLHVLNLSEEVVRQRVMKTQGNESADGPRPGNAPVIQKLYQ